MTDMTEVVRTWQAGRDGRLHAALRIGGEAQSYCARSLAPKPRSTPGRLPLHEECMQLELVRMSGTTDATHRHD